MALQPQPSDPRARERVDASWRVRGRPEFDVAGGVRVFVEVPHEPAQRAATGPGSTATVKLWSRASHEPTPILAHGAPDAVRTEATPCSLEMPASPLPILRASYYSLAIRVFVDLVEVDGFSAVFDANTGEELRRVDL